MRWLICLLLSSGCSRRVETFQLSSGETHYRADVIREGDRDFEVVIHRGDELLHPEHHLVGFERPLLHEGQLMARERRLGVWFRFRLDGDQVRFEINPTETVRSPPPPGLAPPAADSGQRP